jgi:hypothetical protein
MISVLNIKKIMSHLLLRYRNSHVNPRKLEEIFLIPYILCKCILKQIKSIDIELPYFSST